MSGHPSYPWKEGDPLFASELNAAIASAGGAGLFLPLTGGIVSGPTEFHSTTGNALQVFTDYAGPANGISGIYTTTTNRGPHMTSGVRFDYFSAGKEAGFDTSLMVMGIYDPVLPVTSGVAVYQSLFTVAQSPDDAVNNFLVSLVK